MVVKKDAANEKSIVTPENKNVVNMEHVMESLESVRRSIASGKREIRVATLYRVSTKKQLNPSENDGDIPAQQKSCQDFIDSKPGWVLVKEYKEKGVSGFKKKASERDELKQILYDAANDKFDVLLVFMFDRLGRLEDDTPFFIQSLVKTGVEVWSVKEGQQSFDNHIDKLMNYIRAWQSNGESIKTSQRVNEVHRQMVEEGIYRGGTVPFGYKTVPSGKFNKKGKELLKVVVDPEQADTVRMMYDLVDQEGYGQYRIPKLLNEKDIKTNTGKPWASNSVSFVLRNPMYKGYMVYGKGTDKEIISKEQLPDLIIIDEAKWQRVQDFRESRNPENTKKYGVTSVIRNTKGSLILVGMIQCGHCGNPLTSTPNTKKYVRKDGTEFVKTSIKYRCSGKALQKVACNGKTTHSNIRLEGIVLDEVYGYLNQLETVDLTNKILELTKKNSESEVKELQKLKRQLDAEQVKLSKYKAEVIKAISGESKFSDETLNELIEETKRKIMEIQYMIDRAEKELESKKIEHAEIEILQSHLPVWREVFEQASPAKKKMMLSTIINSIHVHRDRIEVDFKLRISQFIGAMGMATMVNVVNGKVLSHSAHSTIG
jgi:site-specific DNA recombinase